MDYRIPINVGYILRATPEIEGMPLSASERFGTRPVVVDFGRKSLTYHVNEGAQFYQLREDAQEECRKAFELLLKCAATAPSLCPVEVTFG